MWVEELKVDIQWRKELHRSVRTCNGIKKRHWGCVFLLRLEGWLEFFFFFERGGLFFLGLMEERDSNLFLPRVEVGPFLLGG